MYFQMAYFQIKYGIPKCRPMMGCMDETNTLEYTEIFEHCLYWPNINLMPESGLKRDRFQVTKKATQHHRIVVAAKSMCLHIK